MAKKSEKKKLFYELPQHIFSYEPTFRHGSTNNPELLKKNKNHRVQPNLVLHTDNEHAASSFPSSVISRQHTFRGLYNRFNPESALLESRTIDQNTSEGATDNAIFTEQKLDKEDLPPNVVVRSNRTNTGLVAPPEVQIEQKNSDTDKIIKEDKKRDKSLTEQASLAPPEPKESDTLSPLKTIKKNIGLVVPDKLADVNSTEPQKKIRKTSFKKKEHKFKVLK